MLDQRVVTDLIRAVQDGLEETDGGAEVGAVAHLRGARVQGAVDGHWTSLSTESIARPGLSGLWGLPGPRR